jgi:hypothetical protein
MSIAHNDGNVPVGPKGATVTINSVVYVVDSASLDLDPTWRVRTDGDDKKNGQWAVDDKPKTGEMNLQLATSTTALPPLYSELTYDFGDGSDTYLVATVGAPAAKGEDRKVRITVREKLGA